MGDRTMSTGEDGKVREKHWQEPGLMRRQCKGVNKEDCGGNREGYTDMCTSAGKARGKVGDDMNTFLWSE